MDGLDFNFCLAEISGQCPIGLVVFKEVYPKICFSNFLAPNSPIKFSCFTTWYLLLCLKPLNIPRYSVYFFFYHLEIIKKLYLAIVDNGVIDNLICVDWWLSHGSIGILTERVNHSKSTKSNDLDLTNLLVTMSPDTLLSVILFPSRFLPVRSVQCRRSP